MTQSPGECETEAAPRSGPSRTGQDTPYQRVTTLLGEGAFLVPCEWGTKKPLVTYVERPFESTKTEAYRAIFSVQDVNVAVYLGKASGGLCAIDFDHDEDLTAFLALNPKLAATLQTRGSRGGMLWVKSWFKFVTSAKRK